MIFHLIRIFILTAALLGVQSSRATGQVFDLTRSVPAKVQRQIGVADDVVQHLLVALFVGLATRPRWLSCADLTQGKRR